MGVDEAVQKVCSWEQRAPDPSPGRPCRADEGRRRRSHRLGERTSRSQGPRDSKEGSSEPGDERCKRPTESQQCRHQGHRPENFRVMVRTESGAGWRREGHKAVNSSEPNPPLGAVLGVGKEVAGQRWRGTQAREPTGRVLKRAFQSWATVSGSPRACSVLGGQRTQSVSGLREERQQRERG